MIRYDPDMKVTSLPLTGGVDETTPANKTALNRAAKMDNWRLSKDGTHIEKRGGLSEEVTNFAVDVFGYTTYKNLAGTFCELAVLETGISRFITGGAWASIHTFSSSIAHPVSVLEIQGKEFVINEVDSRMVHYNGSDYVIGIQAPTGVAPQSLPAASEVYSPTETPPLNESMVYANQAAMDAVWTDSDYGTGESTWDTSDPDSLQGPDGDSDYMRLYVPAMTTDEYARRSLTTSTPVGPIFTIDTSLYFDSLGGLTDSTHLEICVWTGMHKIVLRWGQTGCWLYGLDGYHVRVTTNVYENRWDNWKFLVDSTRGGNIWIEPYLNDVSQGGYWYFNPSTDTPSLVQVTLQGPSFPIARTMDVHIDHLKIVNRTAASHVLEGEYRYAVTYYRGGNFPCESNPIKSVIGAVSFTGTGTNDMTVSGEYTGTSTRTFRILVYTGNAGGGLVDVLQWSDDNGATYKAKVPCSSSVYIGYGLTLAFSTTTTAHVTNDYWTFTCTVCAGMPTIQEITITNLPISADPQVTARKIYRTRRNGSVFYWLATINDNVTTTMTDNIPDSQLGAEMEEDHDTLADLGSGVGKFSAWWDDRLWVSGDDIIYYSALRYPEHFDLVTRYVTIHKGNPNDEITGLKAYKDSLYVFTKKNIFAIQKTVVGFGCYLVCQDAGCRAPWSIVEVNSVLMFISDRGVEVFNGVDVYPLCPSDIIQRTIGTINPAYYDLISAVHHKQFYEVWFSIPDRTSGSAVTIVYHYPTGEFYFFNFYKVPSCLASVFDANGKRVTKIGTRDGFLCLTETGYADNATAITATYRKGWISTIAYEDVRKLELEYELPTSATLTSNVYVNFDDTVQRTDSHAGLTPGATDLELRRPIFDFSELGQRAKYFAVELTHAANAGGAVKVNDLKLYHRDRAHKGRITSS